MGRSHPIRHFLDDVTDFSDAVLYDGTVCGSYGPFITLYPG